MQTSIGAVAESRGFAVSRVLTHWTEIVGADLAAMARPVDVSYGREGMGATLTVLTTGPLATILDMRKAELCDRVNAAYGYRAIARVRVTQTAPTGFAEGQVQFAPAPKPDPVPDPTTKAEAAGLATGADDERLRLALETLAANVLTKRKS